MGGFSLSDIACDVGQPEDLPARVAPTQRAGHLAWCPLRPIQVMVSAVGIRLQDPVPVGEVFVGMGHFPIAGDMEQGPGRCATAKWQIIAYIGPEPRRFGAATGEQRDSGVIPV